MDFLWYGIPEPSNTEKTNKIRAYIGDVLRQSDWTQLPNSGLTLPDLTERMRLP